MTKCKVLCLASLVSVLLLVNCGKKKTETGEETTTTTTEQRGTPVDQPTVGELSGKVVFQGAKPNLATIHMDQDPVCVQKHSTPVHVEDGEANDNGTLPNVFVYVK